ncbi:MAG TPA: hypothetical protein VK992_02455, partial [Candidatus Caenarcaniphilales bacterium]|nr:hypothetical protein [Candidatus Caenarcaniphilales bacterium]
AATVACVPFAGGGDRSELYLRPIHVIDEANAVLRCTSYLPARTAPIDRERRNNVSAANPHGDTSRLTLTWSTRLCDLHVIRRAVRDPHRVVVENTRPCRAVDLTYAVLLVLRQPIDAHLVKGKRAQIAAPSPSPSPSPSD